MAIRRSVFEELGGFDEALGVDLNDVDLCLRAIDGGYRVVYEPRAELVHHESPSRGRREAWKTFSDSSNVGKRCSSPEIRS